MRARTSRRKIVCKARLKCLNKDMTTEQAIESFRETYAGLRNEIGKMIVGHESIVEATLIALFAGGHVLLE